MSSRLSVLIAALDDYSIVEQVHQCVEAQTIRDVLEIILICRSRTHLNLPVDFESSYPDIVVIESGDTILLNEARELGVRQASTPFVLILEDHCLPSAGCLEEMLVRLEEGWSAVGPAIVNGNTVSRVAVATNLLTYGEWMGRTAGGERGFVAGYSSAFPVRVLLARGDRLTEDLIAPSTLQMSLAEEGHRFYFEPKAVMAHWEASDYDGVRQILSKNGRGLGVLRARQWSFLQKVFFSLVSPLLMGHRLLRAARTWWRVGGGSGVVLLHLLPLSMIWTFGELRGYWCRDRQEAFEGVSDVEKNRQRFVDDSLEPIRKPY